MVPAPRRISFDRSDLAYVASHQRYSGRSGMHIDEAVIELALDKLTSIEQKIHKINVCITTNAADPTPNAK